MNPPCVLIAGGGTGGHVFPALAVADELRAQAAINIVFCGTRRGVEARVIPAAGWPLELLDVAPMLGGGAWRALKGTAIAGVATVRAADILRRWRPRAVLSVGGYASGPVSLAAAIRGIPVALLEPNSVVGLANRLVGLVARRAYVADAGAGARFRVEVRRVLGVPLRRGFSRVPYEARDVPRILVMGGSQGAAALNERLPRALGVLRGRVAFEVVHQAGRDRDAAVRETYASLGIHATVTPFIDDPARAIAEADLLVGRAGASTLAEIAAVGRPALLIPFPDAAGDHQLHNAQAVAAAGAGLCLSQDAATVERLAFEMERLLSDAPLRTSMATASAHTGRPHAAREIATDFLILAGIDRPATSVVDRYSTAHATGEA